MSMKFNQYFQPRTVDEVLDLLKKYEGNCKIVAGGTDVVIRLRMGTLVTEAIIDISRVEELKKITIGKDQAVLGSAKDLRSISVIEELKNSQWEIVGEGAGHVSSTQIRNYGTLGGNVCNASPSADTIPGLMISDAIINIVGPKGKRDVKIEEFFTGPGKTVLAPDELVLSFTLPSQGDRCEAAYHKHAIRGDTDISIVCVGVRIQLDESNRVTKARIALGAVAPTPLRAYAVEDYLIGKTLTDDVVEEAGKMAAALVKPISDQRASKEYRTEMIYVNVKNMIRSAAEKINKGQCA